MNKKQIIEEAKKLNPKDRQEVLNELEGKSQRSRKSGGDRGRDKVFDEGFEASKAEAAAKGKGVIGQTLAGWKGGFKKEEQYQIATMGTKRSLERLLMFAGIQMSDTSRKNFEKKASPEEIEKAKKALGLDEASQKKKKEEEEKAKAEKQKTGKAGRGGALVDKSIVSAILSTKKLVEGIAKVTLVKRGFKAEINEKGGIEYRRTKNTAGAGKRSNKGQFAKEEEASALGASKLSSKRSQEQREAEKNRDKETGLSLKTAIESDETPQAKMAETLQGILKSLGTGNISIHEKLDKIIEQGGGGGGGGFGIGDAIDLMGNRRRGRGRFGKFARRLGARALKMGRGLGRLARLGAGAAAAGAVAEGVGAGLGAPVAEAAAAGAKVAPEVAAAGAKVAPEVAAAGAEATKAAQVAGKAATASKSLKAAQNVLKFLKKIPGLSLIASGAALIAQISNAIDARNNGEIDDNKLHSVISGAVGGALGGLGGAELAGSLGAAAGTAIFPGVGTFIGGLVGGTAGFLAGESAGQWAGEKVWSFFEDKDNVPSSAYDAAKKEQEKNKPAAAPTSPPVAAAAPPEPIKAAPVGEMPAMAPPPAPSAAPAGPSAAAAAAPTTPPPSSSKPGLKTSTPGGYLGQAAEFLSKEEGLPKGGKAYWDPPGQNNLVSVGYGHQIQANEYKQGFIDAGGEQVPVKGERGIDTVMTKDQAKALLAVDLKKYEARAAAPLGGKFSQLSDEEKVALISYAYNTGSTGSLVKAGLLTAINNDDPAAGGEIIADRGIQTAGGKPFPPLKARRKKEGMLYASADSGGSKGAGNGEPGETGGGAAISPAPAATAAAPAATAAPSTSMVASSGVQPQATASSTGGAMAAASNEMVGNQLVAQNQPPAAPVVINNASRGPAQPPQPTMAMAKAKTRSDDNTFIRALARDFAHPTAFTTVSLT